MRKLAGISIVMMAAAMAACAGDTVQPDAAGSLVEAAAGDTVRLGVGQALRIGATGVRVKFVGVAEDSRCPIDAICVWPGTAEVRLELSAPGEAASHVSLHSYSDPRATTYRGYSIRLLEVSPSRSADQAIPAGDYVVKLEILRQ